jgi:hypothetical protein
MVSAWKKKKKKGKTSKFVDAKVTTGMRKKELSAWNGSTGKNGEENEIKA